MEGLGVAIAVAQNHEEFVRLDKRCERSEGGGVAVSNGTYELQLRQYPLVLSV